ncbi:uncharacterized 21.2 kDa protein [Selaginella moellendorffii]|nr:uncharacterized 21.2 kDa protein [Selaginella moellendorffii]|eukprot:XP_002965363.2 uncharacterized 21.2 kDa protein [Selaginella moellendorffii]
MAKTPNFPFDVRSYDVHVYFFQTDQAQLRQARELQDEIRGKFPQFKIKVWDKPIGPHGIGNFEVNLMKHEDFVEFVTWIPLNRRNFSVLIHPNTGNPLRDHTAHAMWIGQKQVLNLSVLTEDDDGYGYFS